MTRLTGRALLVLLVGALVLCFGFADIAYAQPMDRDDVPRSLRDWIPWALDGAPEFRCTYIDNTPVCQWPGQLTLELDRAGGRFEYLVTAQAVGGMSLPGDVRSWPQAVRIDGRRALVVEDSQGRPETVLRAGERRITGRFKWSKLPDRIAIPKRTALVKLTVAEKVVRNPRRNEAGELWLERGPERDEVELSDRMDVVVYRHIGDGVPLMVETVLRMRVAGKAREVNLGPVLLDGFTVREVSGDIPARIDQDGNLKMQVRAGEFQVHVLAHNEHNPETLTVPAKSEPWPEDEIWSWEADEIFRQVNLSGATGIDSARTEMPAAWRALPAYRLVQEQELKLDTIRRGITETPPDQIHLERRLLFDFDGQGYTVRDHLAGKLSRTQRLDLEGGGVLGNVTVAGVDQLITAEPKTGLFGVEIRNTKLDLSADWRLEDAISQLPAVGWSRDVQSLDASVVLPPGWTLLGISGVDKVHGTWWDSWSLWVFFVVLVISLAVAKLTRWYFGVVALVMLVLCHNESDGPFYIWLTLAVTITLLQVVRHGRMAFLLRALWWAFVFAFFTSAVPFVVQQIRGGIFPQISDNHYGAFEYGMKAEAPVAMDDYETKSDVQRELPTKARKSLANLQGRGGTGEGTVSLGSLELALEKGESVRHRSENIPKQQVVEKGAVVQTGPGLPAWRWQEFPLHFSGPVKKDHIIRLFLISPLANLVLAIARVLLIILVGAVLIRRAMVLGAHRKPESAEAGSSPLPVILPILFSALLWPSGAVAESNPEQSPSQTRLDELKDRLTRRAECQPHCSSTPSMGLKIIEDRVVLSAEVHAGDDIGWPLPGPAENWTPDEITVDGRSSKELLLREDGFYYLRLDRGIHSVEASSPVPGSGVITIEFREKPHSFVIAAPEWNVDGVPASGPIEDSIRLSRLAAPEETEEIGTGADDVHYPSWFNMHRTFSFGVEWQVHTRLTRETPTGAQAFLRLPLLPGEQVNSPDVTVEDGFALLALGRDDESLEWISTLDTTNWMQLAAAADQPWSETWELRCSSIWTCAPSGIAPTRIEKDEMFVSQYRPLPGEQIEIGFAKPNGVEGQSITIDGTRLSVRPGVRLASYGLELDVRTSNGGSQELVLPEGALVESVLLDGEEKSYRNEGSRLQISLLPGAQTIRVAWQQDGGIEAFYRVPRIGLGTSSVNAVQEIELDSDRWIILTGGPRWGPAVLFWGFFISVIFAALLLGRVKYSPLSSVQWALLAIGLTQVPVAASLIIVAWFLIFALREKNPFAQGRGGHNFLQVVLVLFTMVAAGCLLAAVYNGLAVRPDMQVMGGYEGGLSWYSDRVGNELPQPWVLSVPLGIWKLLMLAWALWLATSLVKWGPWAYRAYSTGGAWIKKDNVTS